MQSLTLKHRTARAAFCTAQTSHTMDALMGYPQGSLGFYLGRYLFEHSFEPDPVASKEDVLRLLISPRISSTEDVAMHYYIFGNGDNSLRTLFIVASGLIVFPFRMSYFFSRYKAGKAALRFFDLDHFRMLHLPLSRIKETFCIR